MPWLALPFKDLRMKTAAKHFKIKGLPRLVVLNAKTGESVCEDAVDIVAEQGPVIIEQWLEQVSKWKLLESFNQRTKLVIILNLVARFRTSLRLYVSF